MTIKTRAQWHLPQPAKKGVEGIVHARLNTHFLETISTSLHDPYEPEYYQEYDNMRTGAIFARWIETGNGINSLRRRPSQVLFGLPRAHFECCWLHLSSANESRNALAALVDLAADVALAWHGYEFSSCRRARVHMVGYQARGKVTCGR